MLITGATIFTGDSLVSGLGVRLAQGRVAEAGEGLTPAPGERTVDLGGDYLLPGFVDVHIHAFRGHDTMRGEADIRAMSRDLYNEGVALFCPTTMSASVEETRTAVLAAEAVRLTPEARGARVAGAHMEAPFLSPEKAGAQMKQYFQSPSWSAFEAMTGGLTGAVRLITLAPELPGSEAFIRRAAAEGIHVSVGHTAATAAQTHLAADWGADHVTHTFNAQTPLHHREPGVPGASLVDDRLYCELIADGVHLHPDAVRLLVRCKGARRAVAITDAMEAAGLPDGGYSLGGQRVIVRGAEARLENGTLAGSVLTLRLALENLIHRFGIAPEAACAMCTSTPAASIGEEKAGRIRPGSPAPLTRWSADWRWMGILDGCD